MGKDNFVRTSMIKQQDSSDVYEVKEIPVIDGAEYDDLGFYNLLDGSFYDPDGHYFNQEGYDELGGQYDDNNIYIPGEKASHMFDQDGDDDDYDNRFENDELA